MASIIKETRKSVTDAIINACEGKEELKDNALKAGRKAKQDYVNNIVTHMKLSHAFSSENT